MPKLHTVILEQIRSLMEEAPTKQLSIDLLGEIEASAENTSELEFCGADGEWYILSIIERDT